MSKFIALKEKDGVEFSHELPFNPLESGWIYDGACCCNIRFTKGEKMIIVSAKKNRISVKVGERIVGGYVVPSNQTEFEIINKWL